ncbi:MAG: MmgE/PrpD family protein [Hyphomicrobiaceae bacterium]|nr:MmgE/PrpD family protein [Hyphomicrobiaceae bacterium]
MTSASELPIAVRLGEWSAGLRLADVPGDVQHAAKRCIIDTIGVAVAGSQTPVAARMAAHVGECYGPGMCRVFGSDKRSTAVGAAFANGTAAHALDFDDTSYAGIIHGSMVILPAVLAASEQKGVDGARFLEAFIAGAETAYALGLTLTDSHYMSGWWATSTLGAVGASAGAARAFVLSGSDITAAIAFAALQASGMVAILGYDAKPVMAGQAAKRGVESALLAAQKNTAPPNAFEDRRGFIELMNEGRCDSAGLSELGRTWRLIDPGVAVKAAPLCSATQAAIEVTQRLIEKHGLERTEIRHVRCEVPKLVKISLVHDRPQTPAQAQFSMPFAIGCVLAFGSVGPEHISQDVLGNASLRAAMEKVEMVEAEDLNGPDYQPHFPECARIVIEMTGGAQVADFLGTPTGASESPMSDEALSAKFRKCVAFAGWSEGQAESVLEGLWNIENAGNMTELIEGEMACATP